MAARAPTREQLLARYDFPLDDYQIRAIDALDDGRSVLVAAPTGLGYMINNARTLFRSDYILLGMVLIGALGLLLDYLMRQAARFAMPWHRQ